MENNDDMGPALIPDVDPSPGRRGDGRVSDDDVEMVGQGDVSESILDSYDEDEAPPPPAG